MLILPDILTTPGDYAKLVDEFADYSVYVYIYKGDTLKNRKEDLVRYLKHNKFEYIVGFGMGANLALKSGTKDKFILVNPIYGGLSELCAKLDESTLKLLRMSKFVTKLVCLFTVNKWGKIPDSLVKNLMTCDTYVTSKFINDLVHDDFLLMRPQHDVSIICSTDDRIVPRDNVVLLGKSCPDVYMYDIKGGHYIQFEAYDKLVEGIRRCIERYKK
jgi:pimeloyl-ACP methyl ester carboxylesterase